MRRHARPLADDRHIPRARRMRQRDDGQQQLRRQVARQLLPAAKGQRRVEPLALHGRVRLPIRRERDEAVRAAPCAHGRRAAVSIVWKRVLARRRDDAVPVDAAGQAREIESRRRRDGDEQRHRTDHGQRETRAPGELRDRSACGCIGCPETRADGEQPDAEPDVDQRAADEKLLEAQHGHEQQTGDDHADDRAEGIHGIDSADRALARSRAHEHTRDQR